MFFSSVKKFLGTKKESDPKKPEALSTSLAQSLREKSGKLSQFFSDKLAFAQDEFFSIKEKCQDLRQTNFDLGMKHLDDGALPEAIFRFRLIKKFWPDYFDAYYQLAYCLALRENVTEAQKVLTELLNKDPNYDPIAKELLAHLNQINSDAKTS